MVLSRLNDADHSRYDTLVAIHNYICEHLEYGVIDLPGEETEVQCFTNIDTATSMFGGENRRGKVNYRGYARAFQLLCEEFNIP